LNCWEFKKCGREKGGANADSFGVCPAYPDNGKNCARMAGTFPQKLHNCMKCEFYKSEHYNKAFVNNK
jgi:hypothetical protein